MTDDRTTELRVKLTERGVEWTKPKSVAEFIQTTFLCNGWGIEVLERNIGLCVTATNVFDTPEQVIAATIGGTLTAEQVREAIMSVDRWEKPMGNTGLTNTHLIIRDDAWQAIADELNRIRKLILHITNCGKAVER